MMFSIFSYAYWLSVYLLWKNVYSGLVPIFNRIVVLILSCMSCSYSLDICHIICKCFILYHRLSFHFVSGFPCKSFKIELDPIYLLCFYFLCLKRHPEYYGYNLFKECSMYVFF